MQIHDFHRNHQSGSIMGAVALSERYRRIGEFRLRNWSMTTSGLDVIIGKDMTRIKVVCEHQSGLIYVVPADRSWVCDQVNLPAHALAGFFRELNSLENKDVQGLMQQWGIYYRQLPKDQEYTAEPE